MKTTATAFIFHNGKLLVVKHRKLGRWMHVGGHVEEGETPDEALRREIREETGLEVEILSLQAPKTTAAENVRVLPVPFFIHSSEIKGERRVAYDYICVVKGSPEVRLQHEELDDFAWVGEEELGRFGLFPVLEELARAAFAVVKTNK